VSAWTTFALLAGAPPAGVAVGALAVAALGAVIGRLALASTAQGRAATLDARVEAVVRDAATPAFVVAPTERSSMPRLAPPDSSATGWRRSFGCRSAI
jgi:hypothetical protein